MKYKINYEKQAEKDLEKLDIESQNIILEAIEIIENQGIEYVTTRYLGKKLYEIKASYMRAIYKYKDNQIILVGVIFKKKSQKTPKNIIERAEKILT